MKTPARTMGRREFVGSMAAALGGMTLAGRVESRPRAGARQGGPASTKRVNVAGMSATDPILKSYAAAITAMRQLSESNPKDPLGWTFQANMHWTPAGEMVLDAWNGCQHGTRWFFPWHRGYLYFFERILRKMANDPEFVLPYWKWDDPASLTLPLPFRADPSSPLYDDTRGTNDGTPFDTQLAADLTEALSQDFFDPSADGRQGFTLLFDGGPHGDVHVETGGRMGSVPTAARDPIFYLHHANVDRLWNRWLDNPQHANPTDDQWLQNQWNQGQTVRFKYYDADGTLVQLTTAEVLKLPSGGARYDDDREPIAAGAKLAPQGLQRVVPPATLASASKEAYALTNQPTPVTLSLGPTATKRMARTLAAAAARRTTPAGGPRVFVVIQGITAKAAEVPVHYYVYLKSKGQKDEETGEYIGSINFFGRTEHHEQGEEHGHGGAGPSFDQKLEVTAALTKLGKGSPQPIQDLVVTLVPVLNGKRKDKEALARTKVEGLSFERMVIQTVE